MSRPPASRFPLIGPHEGRELELMLAGKKPLALFSAPTFEAETLPIKDFAPYVDDGLIIEFDEVFCTSTKELAGLEIRLILFARREEAWRIDEAKKLILPVILGESPPTDEVDAQLGKLLGYPEEAISAYIHDSKIRPLVSINRPEEPSAEVLAKFGIRRDTAAE